MHAADSNISMELGLIDLTSPEFYFTNFLSVGTKYPDDDMTADVISHARTFVVTPIRSIRKLEFTDVVLVRGRWNGDMETRRWVAVHVVSNDDYGKMSPMNVIKKQAKQIHRGTISCFTGGYVTICEYVYFHGFRSQMIAMIYVVEFVYCSWSE